MTRRPSVRQMRRKMGNAPAQGTFRHPSPTTGKPAHFTRWKQEAAVKKHLEKMPTQWLAEQVMRKENARLAAPLFKLAGTFPNVWILSQARRADLLKVEGVGPAGLNKLEGYLISHEVQLRWDEPHAD